MYTMPINQEHMCVRMSDVEDVVILSFVLLALSHVYKQSDMVGVMNRMRVCKLARCHCGLAYCFMLFTCPWRNISIASDQIAVRVEAMANELQLALVASVNQDKFGFDTVNLESKEAA